MNTETPVNNNSTPSIATGKLPKISSFFRNRIFLVFMGFLIFLILIFLLITVYKKQPISPKELPSSNNTVNQSGRVILPTLNQKENKIIAKVGEENIYENDFRQELSFLPPLNIDERAFLLEKIASDSVILQSGAKEKIITLADNFFNSPDKDYRERMNKLNTVKTAITNQAQQIEGYVVSIWFNNDGPGEIGYEKGKALAKPKITQLHQKVKNGQITVEQAGEEIKNDTGLAQIDSNYKGNAILKFLANPDDKITFDPDFNQALWNLNENEVSDIFLIKDAQRGTGDMIDSVYMFGKIQKKVVNENINSFQNWFSKQNPLYEIKYL